MGMVSLLWVLAHYNKCFGVLDLLTFAVANISCTYIMYLVTLVVRLLLKPLRIWWEVGGGNGRGCWWENIVVVTRRHSRLGSNFYI